ncbi:uncharacterized protein B0H18DRAFT_1044317 [Fomitopsis serialis]|uniref:uncharacterized protein n=1 Tax=Fomitopsis serialis TaxID=139415 RepID=UPI002008C28C|nr:uncharacterized protein B0H18DRAFT_1044317 [Neoantrodia serialis]KAH9914703.1 hypothetical protein B0H18DRAFT_1044317 [Neoantrodia serialis]
MPTRDHSVFPSSRSLSDRNSQEDAPRGGSGLWNRDYLKSSFVTLLHIYAHRQLCCAHTLRPQCLTRPR